jgi:hypothetical protein
MGGDEESCGDWMNDVRSIAVGGYKRVLEDVPDVCDSESSAEYGDHGEELADGYAPGCSSLAQARMTEAQAEWLRNR